MERNLLLGTPDMAEDEIECYGALTDLMAGRVEGIYPAIMRAELDGEEVAVLVGVDTDVEEDGGQNFYPMALLLPDAPGRELVRRLQPVVNECCNVDVIDNAVNNP